MADIQDTPILEENKTVNQVYNWKYILNIASEHKREIVYANIIAILATLASVPLPLLMPLLVDEVLLNQPAIVVATINANTPDAWHGPTLYITVILIFTLCLRLTALVLNVWQSRQFTIIAKDVIFRIRHSLLSHLEKVSMSEYETLGSGTVASYLVTDLQTIDDFVGTWHCSSCWLIQ
jgi:ATP-binding cassette subfamily C protein